jgi:hypothetical protein
MAEDAPPDAILDQLEADNHATIAANTTCNLTYAREYKVFCKWVQSQAHLACVEAPFLTRRNIDHYFTSVIASKASNTNTTRRVLNALNWHATHREHIGANPKFECESHRVTQALVVQKIYQKSAGGTAKPGSDPHHGLKDIMPESDRIRIMEHIYRHRADWEASAVNITSGMNGAIRGASNRVLVLADLNLSYGFGPERHGPLGRAFLIILRKGNVHKDRADLDKQVCFWRHKRYLLCSVFSTAASVIFKLTNHPTVDFYHPGDTRLSRASWWDIPLIDWDEYSGECAAKMRTLLNNVLYCSHLVLLRQRHPIPRRKYTKHVELRPARSRTIVR